MTPTNSTINSLIAEIKAIQAKADDCRRRIDDAAEAEKAPDGGLRWHPDGTPWSPYPSIAPLAVELNDLTNQFLKLEELKRAARRMARSNAGARGYVMTVEAVVAGEQLEQVEIDTAIRRAGKDAAAFAADVEFVRRALASEAAVLNAEIELVGAVEALAAERRAIGDKGRNLGLPAPYMTGDVTGNIVTRYHQLQPLVAEHAKNLARVATMKAAVRNAPKIAAQLAAWRRSGGKVRS